MPLRTTYDYIVLGATLPGCVFAAAKAKAGHSVLLTNQYGFPGGDITERLVCTQEIPSVTDGPLASLFRAVTFDLLAPGVVNPESVKYGLLEYLEASTVDLCFHLQPYRIGLEREDVRMTFLAKEGMVHIHGRRMVDATETMISSTLLGHHVQYGEHRINTIVSVPQDRDFLSDGRIAEAVRLNDGRYWISLSVQTDDGLFGESAAHDVVDGFRPLLERSGARIQLLPLGIHAPVSGAVPVPDAAPWRTIDALLSTAAEPRRQFIRASRILDVIEIF